jgi:hypothetical protein
VIRWEAVKASTLVITFDDSETSVENIVASLKEGKLAVQGKPAILK